MAGRKEPQRAEQMASNWVAQSDRELVEQKAIRWAALLASSTVVWTVSHSVGRMVGS